ncbi:MAG: hypothetical protein IPM07_14370 [Anaerolineales bacterium]|nr:hypothetical protein [Anaerolineales bacterium]
MMRSTASVTTPRPFQRGMSVSCGGDTPCTPRWFGNFGAVLNTIEAELAQRTQLPFA